MPPTHSWRQQPADAPVDRRVQQQQPCAGKVRPPTIDNVQLFINATRHKYNGGRQLRLTWAASSLRIERRHRAPRSRAEMTTLTSCMTHDRQLHGCCLSIGLCPQQSHTLKFGTANTPRVALTYKVDSFVYRLRHTHRRATSSANYTVTSWICMLSGHTSTWHWSVSALTYDVRTFTTSTSCRQQCTYRLEMTERAQTRLGGATVRSRPWTRLSAEDDKYSLYDWTRQRDSNRPRR